MKPTRPMTPRLLSLLSIVFALGFMPVAEAQDGESTETSEESASDPSRAGQSPAPGQSVPDRQTAGGRQSAADPGQSQPAAASESDCTDREDDDGDGLTDCADADCFDADVCHAGGSEERSPQACSDHVDNDGDGATDCDDQDCQQAGITYCEGSWGQGQMASSGQGAQYLDAIPELGEGMSVEDLVGRGDDANGERTDEVCSDGIDNDEDGRIDCADFGCRFDPQVTVCRGSAGIRFSVVAGVGAASTWSYDQSGTSERISNLSEAGFTLIQLRALGSIPFIENSFFLLSVRAEERVRLTFATFQVPISDRGHYLNINSGYGGLSPNLVISAARLPLLVPAFYFYRAFEQGNGAAIEVGGPIDDDNRVRFRVWAAGGSGEFAGNVGSGFFRSDDRNFTWTAGAAFQFNAIGYFDRFDSPVLYTPVPMTLGFVAGGKYDQRAAERFVATYGFGIFQLWHFAFRVEDYYRFIFDDPNTIPMQNAINAQLSALIWPRTLLLAADVGGVWQTEPYSPGAMPTDPSFRQQLDEWQWRVALHWFFFRSTGVLAALYRETYFMENVDDLSQPEVERELRLEARFRF